MKSNQKLLIMFWLKKSKTTQKTGTAPLYARITIDGEEEEISTSLKIKPDNWDCKGKRDTEPSTAARKTNLKIAETEIDLDRIFTVLQSQFEVVTPTMLKAAYKNRGKTDKVPEEKVKQKTLLDAFSDFIAKFEKQVEKKLRSNDTLKHWRTAKDKVAEFIKFQYKGNDINLTDIQYSFAEEFYDYHTLEVKEPLSEITTKGYLKKTKQILKGCASKNYIAKNPIQEYSCSGGEKEVMPLEFFEVQKIIDKQFDNIRLEEVRDAYTFQMFTGFAFQDLYALSKENIVKVGINGERWLIKDRGKTGVSEMVPILPIVEELIAKYQNNQYCIDNDVLVPVNSNQRYNGYLKEVAVICDIKRELNTHLARHTFADMMLNAGVPLEDVSKMLGHKSIRTTQRYCKVRKERISEHMGLAKAKLFDKNGILKKVA